MNALGKFLLGVCFCCFVCYVNAQSFAEFNVSAHQLLPGEQWCAKFNLGGTEKYTTCAQKLSVIPVNVKFKYNPQGKSILTVSCGDIQNPNFSVKNSKGKILEGKVTAFANWVTTQQFVEVGEKDNRRMLCEYLINIQCNLSVKGAGTYSELVIWKLSILEKISPDGIEKSEPQSITLSKIERNSKEWRAMFED